MCKNNSRSFRFSDATFSELESFNGANLSEKFENIVEHCFLEEAQIGERIEIQKKNLDDLTLKCNAKREELYNLVLLTTAKGNLMLSLGDTMAKLRLLDDAIDTQL